MNHADILEQRFEQIAAECEKKIHDFVVREKRQRRQIIRIAFYVGFACGAIGIGATLALVAFIFSY